jgi:hypothetical protein
MVDSFQYFIKPFCAKFHCAKIDIIIWTIERSMPIYTVGSLNKEVTCILVGPTGRLRGPFIAHDTCQELRRKIGWICIVATIRLAEFLGLGNLGTLHKHWQFEHRIHVIVAWIQQEILYFW